MIIVSSLSIDNVHTIEIKDNRRYAAIRQKGNWMIIFIKCLIKFWIKPTYHGKSKLDKY